MNKIKIFVYAVFILLNASHLIAELNVNLKKINTP